MFLFYLGFFFWHFTIICPHIRSCLSIVAICANGRKHALWTLVTTLGHQILCLHLHWDIVLPSNEACLRNVMVLLLLLLWHHLMYRTIVALHKRLVDTIVLLSMGKVSLSSLCTLGSLVRTAHHTDTVIERALHHGHWLHLHLRLVVWGCSMREKSLIDLQ